MTSSNMSFGEFALITLLATAGGIFGDLLAAFIEGSLLGAITWFQAIGIFVGILLVLILSYVITNWGSKKKEKAQLLVEIEQRRARLQALESNHKSTGVWNIDNLREWNECQQDIAEFKVKLIQMGEQITEHFLDKREPPKLPWYLRLRYALQSILMVWIFLLAFTLAIPGSLAAQTIIINTFPDILPDHIDPDPLPTATPASPTAVSSPPAGQPSSTPNLTPAATEIGQPQSDAAPAAAAAQATPTTPSTPDPLSRRVLWVVSKGQDPELDNEGTPFYLPERYTAARSAFEDTGYTVEFTREDQTDVSLLPLSDYRLILINIGWAWDIPYSQQEAQDLLAYAAAGGTLIIIAEHQNTDRNQHLESITTPMGVNIGGPYIGQTNPEQLSVFTDHPIFDNVSTIVLDYYSGELTLTDAAQVVAQAAHANGQIGIVALEHKNGKIVIMGDMGILHDTEFRQGDNATFFSNTLDWLLPQ